MGARVPELCSARDGDLGSVCHRNGAEGRSVELLINVHSTAVPPGPRHLSGTSCPGWRGAGPPPCGRPPDTPGPARQTSGLSPARAPRSENASLSSLDKHTQGQVFISNKDTEMGLGNLFITIHFICQVILNTKKKGPPASPDCPPG